MNELKLDKTVYVIMPVSSTATCTTSEWADIFSEVFTPAFAACDYGCKRAYPSTGNLIKSLITELRSSWLVLADLTDRNANVFYELGVRHSLSKRTILVAQKSEHIPSDLLGYWWLEYGTKPGDVAIFRRKLGELVSQIEAEPDRSDSPVSDFLEHEAAGVSTYMARENVKKLSALITELSATINTLSEVAKDDRFINFLHADCLDLLLNTLYVDIGPTLLGKCHELRHAIRIVVGVHGHTQSFIEQTRSLAAEVLEKTHDILMLLKRSEYVEPQNISMMYWTPLPTSDTGENVHNYGHYSRADDMSTISLDEIRKHLGKA